MTMVSLRADNGGMTVMFGWREVLGKRRIGTVPTGQLPLLCHSCSTGAAGTRSDLDVLYS